MTISNSLSKTSFRRFPTLRIKAATLAAEARIIRHQEKAAAKAGHTDWVNRLHGHRKHEVRKAARETLLALAYLRGKPYLAVEGKVLWQNALSDDDTVLIWKAVYRHAAGSVVGESEKDVAAWVVNGTLRPALAALAAERAKAAAVAA
jgi:hypothetical protein